MVQAPGRVSVTLGCPQASVNFCPMMRATRSTEPPGANGTMILIGFSGYLSAGDCAQLAGPGKIITTAEKAIGSGGLTDSTRRSFTFPLPALVSTFFPVAARL